MPQLINTPDRSIRGCGGSARGVCRGPRPGRWSVCEARARKWYISADPESIPACGVNLVSVLLAERSDWKETSHYQIGPAQHVSPKHTPLFFLFFSFFFLCHRVEAEFSKPQGWLWVEPCQGLSPLYTGVLYKIVSGLYVGPNPNRIFKFFAKLLIFLFYPKALKAMKRKLAWLKLSSAGWYCNHLNAQTLLPSAGKRRQKAFESGAET